MTSILDHFYNALPLRPGTGVARMRVSPPSSLCVPRFMFRRRDSRLPKWWNGRHARLRGVWRKPCGFKSRLRHQTQQSFDELTAHQRLAANTARSFQHHLSSGASSLRQGAPDTSTCTIRLIVQPPARIDGSAMTPLLQINGPIPLGPNYIPNCQSSLTAYSGLVL